MRRWKKTKEEEWAPGFWKFSYRDDSYDPGDAMWLFSDSNRRTGQVRIVCRYDSLNSGWIPPELVPDVIEILQRYRDHHFSALEQLAHEAE
jgi:hypothetical protein